MIAINSATAARAAARHATAAYQRPAPWYYPKSSQKPTAAPKPQLKGGARGLASSTPAGTRRTKPKLRPRAEKPQKRCQTSDGTRTGLEACPRVAACPVRVLRAYAVAGSPNLHSHAQAPRLHRYDDDDAIVEEAAFPWWRLTFGVVVLGGLAWVFPQSTLDGAYTRLSRTVPLPGAVFGSSSSEYERV